MPSSVRDLCAAVPDPFDSRLHLVSLLEWRANTSPDRRYLSICGREYTFGEMDQRARQLAGGLYELGVRPGDRVAWLSANRAEVVELLFALAKLGAIQVPLNAFLKGSFLAHPLEQSGASVLVGDAAGVDAVASVLDTLPALRTVVAIEGRPEGLSWPRTVDVVDFDRVSHSVAVAPELSLDPGDTAAIMFTSGTTGLPKGCVLTHGYFRRNVAAFGAGMGVEASDVVYTSLPLFHMAAQVSTLFSPLVFGTQAVIDDQFSAGGFMSRAAEVGATISVAIGAMGQALLSTVPSAADRAHSLRAMVMIPMAPEDQARFEERFGIEAWSEVYGQTECIPICCTPRTSAARDRAGCGAPMDDLEVALVDDHDQPVAAGEIGEIVVRPRGRFAMFEGYWNMPVETLAAFRNLWYHTGDYGRLLPSGQLTFVDRKKDALRRRGENISSFELETAIAHHPAVAEVAVHAVPSEMTEDDVKACIVLRPAADVEPQELFDFFSDNLPFYAIPRYVEFVDMLPRTATGRVMKHELRARSVSEVTWDFEQLGIRVAGDKRRRSVH